MVEELLYILEDITDFRSFDKTKSQAYLSNARNKKYTQEEAMKLMMKEPSVFLAPIEFIMFTADTGLNITLGQYATIIMKQAKKQRNQKLFEAAKAAYEIGKKSGI